MTNQSTQQKKKLHTAITAGFLGLVVLVGVSVLYDGGSYSSPTQQAEAGETIERNQSAEFTISTTPIAPSVDSISRTTGGGTVYENENYQIEWSTTDADFQDGQVEASGDGWPNRTIDPSGTYSDSRSSAGDYTYTITAEDVEGEQPDSESLTVSVEERPTRYDLSLEQTGIDIEGVPGSTAEQGVEIDGESGFDGDVDLSVEDIPDSLKDENGNNKVDFSFEDSTINGSGSTNLNMEVIQAIDESVSPQITVRAEAPSGSVNKGDHNQEETFRLNTDAFYPRTIEEF